MPFEVAMGAVGITAILAYFAFRYFKYGSIRGAMYKSPVRRTIGELNLKPFGGVATSLSVHVLEDGRIVLEKGSRALLSYALDGFPMTAQDADELISLLQQAKRDG